MFNKVASDIFSQVIQPRWSKSVNSAESPRQWHKSFVKVAKESNIISVDLAASLSRSPSLLTLMYSSLEQKQQFPSAQLFAINIAYDMSQDSFDCDLEHIPELWRLRVFASAVREQWLTSIENCFFLNNRFMDIYNARPAELMDKDYECPPELDTLLCNSHALRAAYIKHNHDQDKPDQWVTVKNDNKPVLSTPFSSFDESLNVA